MGAGSKVTFGEEERATHKQAGDKTGCRKCNWNTPITMPAGTFPSLDSCREATQTHVSSLYPHTQSGVSGDFLNQNFMALSQSSIASILDI